VAGEVRVRFLQISSLALLFVLPFSTVALADTATIAASGLWGAGAPTSNWSAPGETWSFSMTLSSPTPVSLVAMDPDDLVTTAIISFSYLLNGSAVSIPPEDVQFFALAEGGGLEIDFSAGGMDTTAGITCGVVIPCTFELFGDQLYTGGAPNITLQPGSVTAVDFDLTAATVVDGMLEDSGTGSINSFSVTSSAVTPEPTTTSLLAVGVLALMWRRKRA
jgi:PEP-CTERM motif